MANRWLFIFLIYSMSCVVCLFCRKMSKYLGKLKCAALFRSTRSNSSRGSADMQIDVPSPAVGAPSGSSSTEKHLKLWNKTEKEAYKQLKTRRFIHTFVYDLSLLQSTDMNAEFKIIFKTIGWENVWHIDELGSKLLTVEFLCTLQTTNSEVTFRLFGKEFSIPWK